MGHFGNTWGLHGFKNEELVRSLKDTEKETRKKNDLTKKKRGFIRNWK